MHSYHQKVKIIKQILTFVVRWIRDNIFQAKDVFTSHARWIRLLLEKYYHVFTSTKVNICIIYIFVVLWILMYVCVRIYGAILCHDSDIKGCWFGPLLAPVAYIMLCGQWCDIRCIYVMLATPQGVHNSHAMYHQTTINIVNIHVHVYLDSMGRYRLHKPLCIPQFVFILMLYTMFYVHLCYTVQIGK